MISKGTLAKDLFVVALSSAENLGALDEEELKGAGKQAARICFALSEAFLETYFDMENEDDF